ncbi:RecX family transcriptional regulator [Spirochaetota bacterium]
MKITAIKPQKRKKTRFSIFVDDEYLFSVQDEVVAKSNLYTDKVISESDIKKYQAEDAAVLCRISALRYIYRSMHSLFEIMAFLRKKGFNDNIISRTIKYLTKRGNIDDNKFARKYIESALKYKPAGIYKYRQALAQKGIKKEIIDSVISDCVNDEVQYKNAEILFKKKLRTLKNRTYEQKLMNISNYLKYHGFPYNIIKSVISENLTRG